MYTDEPRKYRRKEKDLRLPEWVVDYTWTVQASYYRQYVAILMFVSKSFNPLTRLVSDPIRMWDDDGPKMCSQAPILGLLTLFVYTLCLELPVSLILPLSLSRCMYIYVYVYNTVAQLCIENCIRATFILVQYRIYNDNNTQSANNNVCPFYLSTGVVFELRPSAATGYPFIFD